SINSAQTYNVRFDYSNALYNEVLRVATTATLDLDLNEDGTAEYQISGRFYFEKVSNDLDSSKEYFKVGFSNLNTKLVLGDPAGTNPVTLDITGGNGGLLITQNSILAQIKVTSISLVNVAQIPTFEFNDTYLEFSKKQVGEEVVSADFTFIDVIYNPDGSINSAQTYNVRFDYSNALYNEVLRVATTATLDLDLNEDGTAEYQISG
ncbi:MAG: hypothetical protein GY849_18265, partial [Deltaproteobacteria bacterium]|nr:hypothetical protein [Deltaproteobacteria bacterium]